ncbi:MAG: precorrin-8X methylmutase [Desulfovibrio sp.]|jgi:precorrin-8X/cobalt-precorrin-8 methylmutase|nr:precorrin-8X methylmutase [Desulfovibrio sp.]
MVTAVMMRDIPLDPAAGPEEIEARSIAIIDAAIPEPRPFAGALWQVARRCVHAVGDTGIVADLRLSGEALEAGVTALARGCAVYADTRMAVAGMPLRRLRPLGVTVTALPEIPGLEDVAARRGVTRARAAVESVAGNLGGQIMVIGNAPTALLALLEAIEAGMSPPALIVGMPVGFVNAAQSKELLARSPWPHFTLLGRRGGSAVAAACVNALAELALTRRDIAFREWQTVHV